MMKILTYNSKSLPLKLLIILLLNYALMLRLNQILKDLYENFQQK